MKKVISFFVALSIMTAWAMPAQASQKYEMTISKSNVSHEVSETLYGAFIEDISFAGDGGLVSNLVNNGSFEYAAKQDAAWMFSNAAAEIKNDKPMNANNTSYAVLSVDGKGIIENIGFPELYKYKTYDVDEEKQSAPDMGFKEGEEYDFSCYVKNIDFEGTFSVYLDSKSNSSDITDISTEGVSSKDWTKLTATLSSKATEDGGLAIVLDGKGSLAVDFVSLVPHGAHGYGSEEWKYTTLRNDLYEALENLSPAFIRFPGGCLAEGTDLNNLYSWKNTIGALEERKQDFNLWQDDNNGRYYNNTNSMGYHEFFQLCEELGAEAVPVLNVGLTCQGRNGYDDHVIAHEKRMVMTDEEWHDYMVNERGWNPDDEQAIVDYTNWIDSFGIRTDEDFEAYLDTIAYRPGTDEFTNYTQDILDLIEYANGDAHTTYWGALRAANGHEKPFNIKYLALGNENWGDVYFRNFDALYNAVKEKYPEITVISSAGSWLEGEPFDKAWETVNSKYADTIVDEHYYTGEQYLFSHNDRYDNYDRNGAGVFIGEYSAKAQGFGTLITKTNLFSAIEEASFMTGFERNGDIVKMASYAPAFAKVNANCWDLNMIWFDSQSVALTPDYYNQLLFSNNTGNKYIDAELTGGDGEGIYHSVTVDESKQIIYVKLVSRDKAKRVRLNFDGFDSVNAASAQILSHKYLPASNEIGKQRVAPREEELELSDGGLDLDLDANSVNVIRIAYGNNSGDNFYRLPENMNLETKAFVPAKTLIAAGVILLCFVIGMAAGLLIYFKIIRRKKPY